MLNKPEKPEPLYDSFTCPSCGFTGKQRRAMPESVRALIDMCAMLKSCVLSGEHLSRFEELTVSDVIAAVHKHYGEDT